ncbi:hypothetical protein RBH26_19845 [Natronolimnohabitans sp. A-GB9]|uniref:hypothetical protein n=1 Tax=Natronolimnohabitans sp. A-GB9 TaxID=3069757 RepID=UPI0027AFB5BA|nr:hypothetical protein [Natronolimnohabitans sp. A-GB9]MDQ2052704.1 hypothetical protein [Natronolimnohabitans sp. A-GB9]
MTEADLEARVDALTDRLETLETALERKDDRIERLETELEAREDRIETLETHARDLETQLAALESRLESHDETLEQHDNQLETHTTHLESHDDQLEEHDDRLETLEPKLTTTATKTEAALKKAEANKQRVRELQARELEKGAHLRADYVDETELEVDGGTLERITKADGHTYYRLPEQADPLARGGEVTLAYGDLLPIQQLARMDEEMRRSTTSALPTRLAAKLWKARTDASVGDDPWEPGGKGIDAYVRASDLKHWIRRQEPGTSDAYAKKLVSRIIDALLDLSRNRLAIRKRTERKNGLEYTERRIVLPEDVDIPGETTNATDR